MNEETDKSTLAVLKEIRDGQQEIIALLSQQHSLAREQLKRSQETIDESVGLQREALRKQRTITQIAVPGILACIAAILYLVFKYF